jgi:hypothetical protein
MSQSERRHERLAVRLSLIISRLVAGETLEHTEHWPPNLACQCAHCVGIFASVWPISTWNSVTGNVVCYPAAVRGADGADLRPSVRWRRFFRR